MSPKITLDGKEYDSENLSDQAKATLSSLQFATTRIQELNNMKLLLRCARDSYGENLKREMLAGKAGFLLDDE